MPTGKRGREDRDMDSPYLIVLSLSDKKREILADSNFNSIVMFSNKKKNPKKRINIHTKVCDVKQKLYYKGRKTLMRRVLNAHTPHTSPHADARDNCE